MSAQENFDRFNVRLDDVTRKILSERLKLASQELLAARSEDARNRIVEDYIREANRL